MISVSGFPVKKKAGRKACFFTFLFMYSFIRPSYIYFSTVVAVKRYFKTKLCQVRPKYKEKDLMEKFRSIKINSIEFSIRASTMFFRLLITLRYNYRLKLDTTLAFEVTHYCCCYYIAQICNMFLYNFNQ